MVPLAPEVAAPLLQKIPVLQKLWLETGEGLLLSRKVVHNPIDIKRNAVVMLELIAEDHGAWYTEEAVRIDLKMEIAEEEEQD